MIYLDQEFIDEQFDYEEFIPYLKKAFTHQVTVPQRPHYTITNPGREDAYLLIMPAWVTNETIGIKLSNVFPGNDSINLPTVQGTYSLMSATNGKWLCQIDALSLTRKRTAASSALASGFLSRTDSQKMLMIGTGALCHELIAAHCCVRNINRVFIWGRNHEKAIHKAKSISLPGVYMQAVKDQKEVMDKVDLISCATLSREPLVFGHLISPGTHVDLVGSFLPDTREADDDVISKGRIYIDTESAKTESGDIVIPLNKGILAEREIQSNLTELCRKERSGRLGPDEITVFKSVGYALEDLAGANYLYEKYTNRKA